MSRFDLADDGYAKLRRVRPLRARFLKVRTLAEGGGVTFPTFAEGYGDVLAKELVVLAEASHRAGTAAGEFGDAARRAFRHDDLSDAMGYALGVMSRRAR